jgi:hypothetical protein
MTLDTRPSVSELRSLDAMHELSVDELLQVASAIGPLLDIERLAREFVVAYLAPTYGGDDYYKARSLALDPLVIALAKVRA